MKFFQRKKSHDGETLDSMRILDDSTPFTIKEAFRTLYMNILYLPIEDKTKKIAITSAFPGEGKTYTSTNLAITISQNSDNRRVLLIDMDMRKSSISKILDKHVKDADCKAGLSEYLTGITDEPNIIQTNFRNLFVLFAGADCVNPAGLITSKKFENFLKDCESKYDYIIIDTPPVMLVSDAALLVGKVNGFLLSARQGRSTTRALSDAYNSLVNVGAQIFGVVFTDENIKTRKRYSNYNNYSDYSSYGNG